MIKYMFYNIFFIYIYRPGGQLMLTDDEKENYKQEDRNTCTCPDDQRWYTATLEYFTIQSPV